MTIPDARAAQLYKHIAGTDIHAVDQDGRPYILTEIAAALRAVERQAFIEGVKRAGHDEAVAELSWNLYCQQASAEGEEHQNDRV